MCFSIAPGALVVLAWHLVSVPAADTPPSEKSIAQELTKIAPLEPSEAVKSFTTVPGFRVDQVAAEPLVHSPIDISFDERGRMYVVEMCDYSEQENEMLGNVRLLEDTDGDGHFDKSTLFADRLSWPTAVLAYDGGVFVGAAPDLLYLKDTSGDDKADERRVVFTGFGRSNVQALLNSFRWGVDNRVHGATGPNGGKVRRPEDPRDTGVSLNGRDFSFDPRKLDLRPESGGGQYGITFDDWGRKFNCDNSNHLYFMTYEDRYVARNPFFAAPGAQQNVGGNQIEIYRTSRVEPWRVARTRMRVQGLATGPIERGGRDSGYISGASGVTIYRGNVFAPRLRQFAFVADPCSNIIHRSHLEPQGVGFTARRVDERCEFVASNDNWCRPVQFANAPDGTLYFVDMYREVIEHPKSLPPEIKQHLDLTSGRDRGRIYRIIPDDFSRQRVDIPAASSAELAALLEHPNGWHRDTAARLLCQRNDAAAVSPLRKLSRDAKSPLARMHALYVLASLDQLTADVVLHALSDSVPRVRQHAVRLAEKFSGDAAILDRLCQLATDPDVGVRYQLAFSLGEFSGGKRNLALAQLVLDQPDIPAIRMAAMTSLNSGAADVLAAVLDRIGKDADVLDGAKEFAGLLATQIGLQTLATDVAVLEVRLAALDAHNPQWAGVLAVAYLNGRDRAEKSKRAVQPISTKLQAVLQAHLDRSNVRALDDTLPLTERVAAIGALTSGKYANLADTFSELLANRQPQEVQLAAVKVLGGWNDLAIGELLVEAWPGLSPPMRKAVGDLLLSRLNWLNAFLTAAESDELSLSELDPAQVQLLKNRTDPELVERLKNLLGKMQSSPRQEVVAAYQTALTLTGNPATGKRQFQKTCATCHRLENVGHEIGPSLAAFKTRGAEAILLNVLDPNREVNPQYVNYLVQCTDGRTLSGMIASENAAAITLRRAENATDTVQRADIDAIRSTRQSIMPEGLEKELNQQALADVIAYILSVK